MYILNKLTMLSAVMLISISTVASPAVPAYAARCGTTDTKYISCEGTKTGTAAFQELIRTTVIAMTVLIGIVATGGIAYAAVLYSSARDSQTQIDQAKTIIRNVVIGLLLYGFMVAIIAWLIPGSVIG